MQTLNLTNHVNPTLSTRKTLFYSIVQVNSYSLSDHNASPIHSTTALDGLRNTAASPHLFRSTKLPNTSDSSGWVHIPSKRTPSPTLCPVSSKIHHENQVANAPPKSHAPHPGEPPGLCQEETQQQQADLDLVKQPAAPSPWFPYPWQIP